MLEKSVGCIKYKVFYKEDTNSERYAGFIVSDIKGICDSIKFDFYKIIYIKVDKTSEYDINESWETFLDIEGIYDTNTIVCGLSTLPGPNESYKKYGTKQGFVIANAAFYETRLGMRSIQSVCGLENAIPFILPTPNIQPVMEKIIKDEYNMPKNKIGANMVEDNYLLIGFGLDYTGDTLFFSDIEPKDALDMVKKTFNNYEEFSKNPKKELRIYTGCMSIFSVIDDYVDRFRDPDMKITEDTTVYNTDFDWEICYYPNKNNTFLEVYKNECKRI